MPRPGGGGVLTSGRSTLQTVGVLAVLALAGVALFLRAQQNATGNLWGVPVDDAYIHFQFARNLASGHGFAFNSNQPVPGSTSPLWVLLLAAAYLIGAPLWLASKVYGVLFLIVAAVLVWKLALRLGKPPLAALAAGALTALDGRLLWAAPSGMEVTLFSALCLGAFLARPRALQTGGSLDASTEPSAVLAVTGTAMRRLLLVAALCGLATLTRPEGLLLSVVVFVDIYRRVRPAPAAIGLAAALYLALVAPYGAFSLATTGHVLPTTFYAKATGLGPWTLPNALNYIKVLVFIGLLTNPAELVIAPAGALALWRARGEARALVVWPALLLIFQALLAPLYYHFGRYEMPLQPFFALWAVVGIERFTRRAPTESTWRAALPSLALVLVGLFALNTWAGVYARSVFEIDHMQVAIAGWVKAHVPTGATVALNDIGAITFMSGHPAVDVVGLVSPRFIALQRERPAGRAAQDVYAEVRREGARYLIIFPDWYPQLAAHAGLQRVYSVTIRRPIVVGAPTMVVYALKS